MNAPGSMNAHDGMNAQDGGQLRADVPERDSLPHDPPRLLVSVQSADEAAMLRDRAVDVIDVKDPSAGTLGMASIETIVGVCQSTPPDKRVSVAGGELVDVRSGEVARLPAEVTYFKLGPARSESPQQWLRMWDRLAPACDDHPNLTRVAVSYADWKGCRAPRPHDLALACIDNGFRVFLIDTNEKRGRHLFDFMPPEELATLARRLERQGVTTVLAGSLRGESLDRAIELRPSLIGVRGAVTDGDRSQTLSLAAVDRILNRLAAGAPKKAIG